MFYVVVSATLTSASHVKFNSISISAAMAGGQKWRIRWVYSTHDWSEKQKAQEKTLAVTEDRLRVGAFDGSV